MENPIQEEKQEWRPLFNGKDLSGWKAYKSEKIALWKVQDEAIVLEPAEDRAEDLITEGVFESFELELQWKISPGGNSGVLWAVQEAQEYEKPYMTGPEIQLLDNREHPDAKISPRRQAGALYDLSAPLKDATKPAGRWNEMRLRIDYEQNSGNVILNGEKINFFPLYGEEWDRQIKESKFNQWKDFARLRRGHLALQDHGDKVWFKEIRIRSLSESR